MTAATLSRRLELEEENVAKQLFSIYRKYFAAADDTDNPYVPNTAEERIAETLIRRVPTYSYETCLCSESYFGNRDTLLYWQVRHRQEPEANEALHLFLKVFGFLEPVRVIVEASANNPGIPINHRVHLSHLANAFLIDTPFPAWVTPHR